MCILLVSSSFAFDDVFNVFRRILKVNSDLTFHYLTFPFLTVSIVFSRCTSGPPLPSLAKCTQTPDLNT